jgi:O-antigen ligase
VWQPPAAAVVNSEFADRADPLRAITFYIALAFVLVKFGMLGEIQTWLMGFNAYLLYLFGVPVAVGILVAGGVRRTLGGGPTSYWLAFNLWMFLCVPFSSWKYGSFILAKNFSRDGLLILFAIAGLVVSWRECRLLMRVIGIAALLNIAVGRLFAVVAGGRLALDFGTVSNSNDYAAHMLLTLPFLTLTLYNARSVVLRVAALLAVCGGVLLILRTGSRGALVALVACAGFAFLRGSAVQRIVLVCLTPIVIVAVFAFVPAAALQRIVSFSASESDASAEALQSSDARRYLLETGLKYTAEFPLFGVGPGQFSSYEGRHNKVYGAHGMWHEAHNAWVQVSSECGIPAAIFFIGGYISSFLLVNRTFRKASRRPDCRDIRNTTFCVMLGMVGFCVAISFLNFAYFYYGPAIAGIAISLGRAANYEFEHRGGAGCQMLAGWKSASSAGCLPAAGFRPALLHGNLTKG